MVLSSLAGLVSFLVRSPSDESLGYYLLPLGLKSQIDALVFVLANSGDWSHSKSRSAYCMQCFFKKTSSSSLKVIFR
jgi:hypothetical protein